MILIDFDIQKNTAIKRLKLYGLVYEGRLGVVAIQCLF